MWKLNLRKDNGRFSRGRYLKNIRIYSQSLKKNSQNPDRSNKTEKKTNGDEKKPYIVLNDSVI